LKRDSGGVKDHAGKSQEGEPEGRVGTGPRENGNKKKAKSEARASGVTRAKGAETKDEGKSKVPREKASHQERLEKVIAHNTNWERSLRER